MEVPLKLTGQQSEITVLLSDSFSDEYKPFKCNACGNFLFEYNNDSIRTILPSGHPQIDRPSKVIVCNGVLSLHGTAQVYDVLYQVMESVFNLQDLLEVQTAVAYLSKTARDKFTVRCKARYYVS